MVPQTENQRKVLRRDSRTLTTAVAHLREPKKALVPKGLPAIRSKHLRSRHPRRRLVIRGPNLLPSRAEERGGKEHLRVGQQRGRAALETQLPTGTAVLNKEL